jgi:hypothetical protein
MGKRLKKKRDEMIDWVEGLLSEKTLNKKTGVLELKVQVTFSDGGIRRVRRTESFTDEVTG